jgi:hypothetical protein
VNEEERDRLRRRVSDARLGALEKDGRLRKQLSARSPEEVKHQTAERKAIFDAQAAHDTDLAPFAIVASRGHEIYLVSVGEGRARVLDLSGDEPSLSAPDDVYALVADGADWLPFTGESHAIVAVAARMIDTAP